MIFAVLTSPVLRFFDNNVINFITTFVFSTLFLSFGFWFFILNQKEQNTLIKFFNAALQKVGLHQKH
jgi:di/tricarboxylate transporter